MGKRVQKLLIYIFIKVSCDVVVPPLLCNRHLKSDIISIDLCRNIPQNGGEMYPSHGKDVITY